MAEIIIESGVTSTGIVAESGDTITILAGGTLAGGTVKAVNFTMAGGEGIIY